MATFFVVGTPIGNLEDITLRALRVLREVDVILCEDTRVTKRLLDKYEIAGKQLFLYNEKKSGVTIEKIIALLEAGKSMALVTDAGTPGISDPGAFVVQKVREHFLQVQPLEDFEVEPVPGPSALTAALSVAGVPASEFLFLGFLPHKKGRETLFREIAASKRSVVFYESPHRILKTLESLNKYLNLGSTSRSEVEPKKPKKIIIARELTKIYEEVKSGTAAELLEYFKNNSEKVRGEFVVLVADSRR